MARELSVSAEVLVRRLTLLGAIPRSVYGAWKPAWRQRHPYRRPVKNGKGGPGLSVLAPHRLGQTYLTLVYGAYWSDAISLRDVCDYVGAAKVESAQRLEETLKARLMGGRGNLALV
jgi:hypothetical protein